MICLFFNIFPLFCYSPLPPLLFTAGDSGAIRDSSRTYPTCSFKGCLQNSESSEKQKQLSRQELEEAVKDLYAKQPLSSERIQVTDPKQFLDSLLPYMLRQHLISEIRQNHQTYYMIRNKMSGQPFNKVIRTFKILSDTKSTDISIQTRLPVHT